MAFCLTILYVSISLLSLQLLGPYLAQYHPEMWIGGSAVLASLLSNLNLRLLTGPSSIFLLILIFDVGASLIVNHWPGGAPGAVMAFAPAAMVFYLILLNARSKRRLIILAVCLAGCALLLIAIGTKAYLARDTMDPMILAQGPGVLRLRAFGILNDPNDLAQYVLITMPLLWVFWRKGSWFRNLFLVLVPTAISLCGLFLTHSRGGLIALLLMVFFTLQQRLGKLKSTLAAVILLVGSSALNFTGGRDVSMQSGSDRLEFWSHSLILFRSSPILGIGFGRVSDFPHTAHNSFVHCAAELGFVGYFFWMGMIVFAIADLRQLERISVAHHEAATSAQTLLSSKGSDSGRALSLCDFERRYAKLLKISFVAYLATSFFLSRPYAITLYLLLGMSAALTSIAKREGVIPANVPLWGRLRTTALIALSSIIFIHMLVAVHWAL